MRYDKLLEGKRVWLTGGAVHPYDAYARLFSEHGADITVIDGSVGDRVGGMDTGTSAGTDITVINGSVGSSFGGTDKGTGKGTGTGKGMGTGMGAGINAAFYKCDLYDSQAIENLCCKLLAERGSPDVYLHVADRYSAAYIDEFDYSELEKMLAVSIIAPYTIMRRIAGPMAKNGGGSVVFVSGHYGVQGMNRVSGYGSAKGGENALACSLAMEYAADGIRVNAIAPGVSFPPVGDDILTQSGEPDTPDFWGTVQPFRRRGRMDELANAALFLASDMASYITGETLLVNGAEHLIAHNHNFPRRDKPMP